MSSKCYKDDNRIVSQDTSRLSHWDLSRGTLSPQGLALGPLLWARISRQLRAAQARAQQSPGRRGGGQALGGGADSVLGLIYAAVARKDGFNSALQVWPEPCCRSISWAVRHFTGACLGRETLCKLGLCLAVPPPGRSGVVMGWAPLGPSGVSVCPCGGGGGGERRRRNKLEGMRKGSSSKRGRARHRRESPSRGPLWDGGLPGQHVRAGAKVQGSV